jgi:aminopeptidase N
VQAHQDGTLAKDMDVKSIMDTWTLQMGFPVVTITRNYQQNTAKITQQRFIIGKTNENQEDTKYSWWIPITYTSPGGTFENSKPLLWLAEGERTKEIYGMPNSGTAVVFNIQQNGYYR